MTQGVAKGRAGGMATSKDRTRFKDQDSSQSLRGLPHRDMSMSVPAPGQEESHPQAQNSLVSHRRQTPEGSQRVAIAPWGSPTRRHRALGVGDSGQVSVTRLCDNWDRFPRGQ